MSNVIEYSPRNKAFVTQIVKVFRDGNHFLFKDLFAKHSLPNLYKAPKDGGLSSDFWMMNDVFSNREPEHAAKETRFMIDSLVKIPGLSTETKMGLYLWSFPHIDAIERVALFGEDGPLKFIGDLAELNDRIHAAKDGRLSSTLTILGTYFHASVVKDQAPEDFAENFKICQSFGGNYTTAIRNLEYQDEENGPNKFERYKAVLASLDESTANNFVWDMGNFFHSYEILKDRGPSAFRGRLEFQQELEVLTRAFGEGDDEFFESLGSSWLNGMSLEGFAKLESALKAHLNNAQPTPPQLGIFGYVENTRLAQQKKRFLKDVETGHWDHASNLVVECFLAGDLPKLEALMADQPVNDFAPLFGAVIQQIALMVPKLVSEGVMGERQKAFALYLHDQSTKGLEAMAERLNELPTAKARNTGRRRQPDDDMIVGVPYSILDEKQREQIVDMGMPPMHPSMMHPAMRGGMHPAMFAGMPPGMFEPFGMHPFDLQDEELELMARREQRLNAGLRGRRGKPDDGSYER